MGMHQQGMYLQLVESCYFASHWHVEVSLRSSPLVALSRKDLSLLCTRQPLMAEASKGSDWSEKKPSTARSWSIPKKQSLQSHGVWSVVSYWRGAERAEMIKRGWVMHRPENTEKPGWLREARRRKEHGEAKRERVRQKITEDVEGWSHKWIRLGLVGGRSHFPVDCKLMRTAVQYPTNRIEPWGQVRNVDSLPSPYSSNCCKGYSFDAS